MRNEAAGVGRSAKDAGGQVAQTAADQARELAAETRQQGRNLMEEGRQQLHEQVVSEQQRAARRLTTIADELAEIAEGRSTSATMSTVARQGADQLHQLASWLQHREPGDLIEEVRSFARRRPGVFLLGAALAGVAVGRITGAGVAAVKDSNGNGSTSAPSTPVQPHSHPETSVEYPVADPELPVPRNPQTQPSMDTVALGGPPVGVAEPVADPCPHCAGEGTDFGADEGLTR
ncbi:MAG: hypothetical protein ABR615_01540 [Pseudonocardiaceae bacterium]